MTWRHTSRTSCSRQPPLTLPVVLPSSATSSFPPSCRYAEPRTRTTVASAARRRAWASCARRSSTSRVSSHCFIVPVRYVGGGHRRNVARALVPPLRIAERGSQGEDLFLPRHGGRRKPGPRLRREAEVLAGAVQGVVDVAMHVLLAEIVIQPRPLERHHGLGVHVGEEQQSALAA